MKRILQSFALLIALLVPVSAHADYVQLAEGVYQNGSTLYISSNVISLGDLQVNPSVVYSFAAAPPTCSANTFSGYDGTLHMPTTSYGAYFTADYWYNFTNMLNDAVEPADITLNNTDVELIVGNTFTITAMVAPNNASVKDVEWTSSDPLIATVDNGTVTALAVGECDIIASCVNKQAVCHVIVTDPISLTLDQTEVTIEQTKQIILTATISPEGSTDQNIVWSTTDTSVATVDNGVVTAIGLGECDIIASYLDKQAVCHVTVIETTIYITLDKNEAKLKPNHAFLITPTMSPLQTDLKVTVSNPDVAAARFVNGIIHVVGLTEGSTMVVVESTGVQALPDTCMVTVYTDLGDVNCDGYVTISDVTLLIDYLLGNEVYPFKTDNADTNRSGAITISDATLLIDYLLGSIDLNPPFTETFIVNGVAFKMVEVECGTFIMGAANDDMEARDDEKPAHEVTLSSYSIGQTEVTQALWIAVMGSNPSWCTSANGFTEDLARPVESISWEDCQIFISKLNEMTGKEFRLPTEAEWEYAARGGNRSQGYRYAGSNYIDDVAWTWNGNLPQTWGLTEPVGSKVSNELGIYDMSGNVWEWCQDWLGRYSSEAQTNPMGPTSGYNHVIRGGAWETGAWACRVTFRSCYSPSDAVSPPGFRLAL